MGRHNINPKTNLPVRDEESDLPVEAFHGRLHATVLFLIPLVKLIFRVKEPIDIENIPKTGGMIIASNHTRWTNVFVAQSVIKHHLFYLGKSSILKWPIAGKMVMSLGNIPVNRSVHNSKALKYAVNLLKKGNVIIIFPEGACNRGKEMLPLKFGAVSMAQKANVPIVPMAIRKGKTMFGKPIKVGKNLEKANDELYKRISAMRKELFNV